MTKPSQMAITALGLSVGMLMASCGSGTPGGERRGDPVQGRAHIERVGCGSCHRIPGIASARGEVGPPLEGLSKRAYLAGVLPNTFDNMVLWIAEPQTVAPGSAMPSVGLTDAEAVDAAAYLYTLD